jgi:hypothetical protein
MRRRLSFTSGVFALAAGLAAPAAAQEAPGTGSAGGASVADGASQSEATDQVPGQDIVVTGIRRSLEQAAAIKREAPQVLDVITAEDVGKLPDANVAEALQRGVDPRSPAGSC